eukprot:Clim_evm6s60 gene=Clim_evmTU6s60
MATNDCAWATTVLETLPTLQHRVLKYDNYVKLAAVACVLRAGTNNGKPTTEILFLKRAERPGDNWSGHVCFPGGHKEPEETLKEAAERETLEEIGLNLKDPAKFKYVGRLDDRFAGGSRRPMAIGAFVYYQISNKTPSIHLSLDEIVAYRWVPVDVFLSTKNQALVQLFSVDARRRFNNTLVHRILKILGATEIEFPYVPLPPSADHHAESIEMTDNSHGPDSDYEFRLWGLTFMVLSEFLHKTSDKDPMDKPRFRTAFPIIDGFINIMLDKEKGSGYAFVQK